MTNIEPSSTKFEVFFENPLYLLYKNHLYNFLVRRFVIRRQLKEKTFKKILELGCGISPLLKQRKGIIQTDFSWRALRHLNSQDRDGKAYRPVSCDATRLPFQDEVFDCVVCSEVLEHIEDDGQALGEIARVLRPGGELYLTCPMHQKYFGFDDEFVGHYRRYEITELQSRLFSHGLDEAQTTTVLGPLEKIIMERVVRLFAHRRKNNDSKRPVSFGFKLLAWLALPFYIAFNYLLATVVYFQAQSVSSEKAVTICFHCRKRTQD